MMGRWKKGRSMRNGWMDRKQKISDIPKLPPQGYVQRSPTGLSGFLEGRYKCFLIPEGQLPAPGVPEQKDPSLPPQRDLCPGLGRRP